MARAAKVGASSALGAAIEFGQKDISILANRLFALARYYASTDSVVEDTWEFETEMEAALDYYAKVRPAVASSKAASKDRGVRTSNPPRPPCNSMGVHHAVCSTLHGLQGSTMVRKPIRRPYGEGLA